ncbi:hypothetical protein H9W90_10195 [Polaribacter pectinis]|uniref:Uncharacterized protein n=1 Tax=Polaribacter pectinis TaxID=2738844 RepID=A0A7G9L7G7_9FLAO|nr:hypothetical protein [Polaribacter pectinis]QNM84566.1 hypothetical protein H9W90_10195 [Polaribacter pectinis]
MATTLFEDKISEYLGIAQKTSHGYYISNGVYHQNLEKVDVNAFIIAVKTAIMMFKVAFYNKENLITEKDKLYSQEGFWNNLKRQQDRFEGIEKYQLDLEANNNNVKEIIYEVSKNNQQVKAQLKKAVEGSLTMLPMLFFRILEKEDKVLFFNDLQSQLIDVYNSYNDAIVDVDFNLAIEIPNNEEILSWFTAKETAAAEKKQQKEQKLIDDKALIEEEKNKAINQANNQIAEAQAAAKKAQEDALKLMAEMQKKYGLN